MGKGSGVDRRSFLLSASLPALYPAIPSLDQSGGLEPCCKKPIHLRNILRWNEEAPPGGKNIEKALLISNPDEWMKKRHALGQILWQFLGAPPPSVTPLNARVTKRQSLSGYTRVEVKYDVGADDGVLADYQADAYVLIPNKISQPTPAILALHPTMPQGKDDVVGISGNPDEFYGLELVQRGYVVLAPDSITAGERVYPGYPPFDTAPFQKLHPHWSAMGKMLWDHMRGLDYLLTLPQVDKEKIGVIGHSLGGYNAFFLAAFDRRIKACVSSCGLATIAGDPRPFRWARNSNSGELPFVHFPKLRPYLEVGCTPPFDFHEAASRVAPTPFLNFSKRQDQIFPNWRGAVAAASEIRKVYALFGAEDKFQFSLKPGRHDFPASSRATAYAWFDRWLRPKTTR